MSSELPANWKFDALESICSRVSVGHVGETSSFFTDGKDGVPFLRSQNVRPNNVDLKEIKFITRDFHEKSKKSQLIGGDLLIVRVGQNRGDCAVLPEDIGDINCANIVFARPLKGYSNFLGAYFNTPVGRNSLLSVSSGSAQLVLNTKSISKIKVPIPPENEALEIGCFSKNIDDRITLLRETNATLEAITQALFKSWFVDFDPVHAKQQGRAPEGMDAQTAALFPDSFEASELGMVPKGWRVAKLGEVTERITKGTTPTTLKRAFVDSGINFIKAESMTGDGGFIPEKFAFIDAETHELLKRSQLKEGDVLISIAGTIGRIAVVTKDFLPANTNQAVALIRPLSNILPSGLINRFLRLKGAQQEMTEKVVQAVQANLSLGSLSDLQVVVPPELQVNALYESGLAQIDRSREVNEQRMRTLAALRDTLLPRLISGQLRLPEAQAQLESVDV